MGDPSLDPKPNGELAYFINAVVGALLFLERERVIYGAAGIGGIALFEYPL